MNPTELKVRDLCCEAFGKDFVFHEPKNTKGKESADIMVPLRDVAISIQVKTRNIGDVDLLSETELNRVQSVIDDAVDQVKTLRRHIRAKQLPSATNERGVEIPFDWDADIRYVGVAVVDVLKDEVSQAEELSIRNGLAKVKNDLVHVFFVSDLEHILDELTTIPDFVLYCDQRQQLIESGRLTIERELDFLAFFKTRTDDVEKLLAGDVTWAVIQDGMWDHYLSMEEERAARAERWKESELFDRIIATAHESVGFHGGTAEQYYRVACELSQFHRTERITLSRRLIEKLRKADEKTSSHFIVKPERLEVSFLFLTSQEPREQRQRRLQIYTLGGVAHGGAPLCVGTATENLSAPRRSFDFVVATGPVPDEIREETAHLFGPMKHESTDDEWGNRAE